MAAKTLVAIKAIGEQMGQKLGDMIFDPADLPDMDGVATMDRRQLQDAAEGLARAAAKTKAFEPASAGVVAEAEQKVKALGKASGYPSFAAGMYDGFHERSAALMPRLVKLSALVAAYDDAARAEVLFLLGHYDRIVRDGRGGLGFREQRLVDAYNGLVGARNHSREIARAWAEEMGRDPYGAGK